MKNKPPPIKAWHLRGDPMDEMWPIDDLPTFFVTFKHWWVVVQPQWRQSNTWPLSRESGGNWNALMKGGPAGLNVIIISLAFWTGSVKKNGNAQAAAQLQVLRDDVTWVMGQVATAVEMKESKGKKRRASEEASGTKKRYFICYGISLIRY